MLVPKKGKVYFDKLYIGEGSQIDLGEVLVNVIEINKSSTTIKYTIKN